MNKNIIISLITFVCCILFIFLLTNHNKKVKNEYEKKFSIDNITS